MSLVYLDMYIIYIYIYMVCVHIYIYIYNLPEHFVLFNVLFMRNASNSKIYKTNSGGESYG